MSSPSQLVTLTQKKVIQKNNPDKVCLGQKGFLIIVYHTTPRRLSAVFEMDKKMEGVNLEEKCLLLKTEVENTVESKEDKENIEEEGKENIEKEKEDKEEAVKEEAAEKSNAVKLVGQVQRKLRKLKKRKMLRKLMAFQKAFDSCSEGCRELMRIQGAFDSCSTKHLRWRGKRARGKLWRNNLSRFFKSIQFELFCTFLILHGKELKSLSNICREKTSQRMTPGN